MSKVEREVTIKKKTGLHARPATEFVQLAQKFTSSIYITVNDKKADAKSIIKVLSLGATEGSKLRIAAEGPDAEEAVRELAVFLETA